MSRRSENKRIKPTGERLRCTCGGTIAFVNDNGIEWNRGRVTIVETTTGLGAELEVRCRQCRADVVIDIATRQRISP